MKWLGIYFNVIILIYLLFSKELNGYKKFTKKLRSVDVWEV